MISRESNHSSADPVCLETKPNPIYQSREPSVKQNTYIKII